MKKSKILFLAVILCVAGVLGYLATTHTKESVSRELRWNSPEKNVYLIKATASANISTGVGGEMKLNQTFLSRMALKVISEDAAELYAVARFIQPEYRVMGQAIPLRLANANIVLNFGTGGEIRRIFYPADFRESESGLITQLFHAMEIHLAPQTEEWEWRAVHDPITVEYRFRISGKTLDRKTLHYANKDAESVTILSSDFSCEISPVFWIDKVYSYEEKAMQMGFAQSNGHLELEMTRIPPMPSDTALWSETNDLRTVFARLRQPARTTDVARRRMQNLASDGNAIEEPIHLSAEEIAAYLDTAIPTLSVQDIDGLDEYVQFLLDNPAAVEMLPGWLLENGGRITDEQHAIFMFTLEKCGSTEAQSALTVIAAASVYGENDNTRAIVALGGVQHINDDSIRFLQGLSRKNATELDRALANSAILNLGAAADRLRESDPFAYRDLISDIRKDLLDSKEDVSRSAALLGSIGNIYDDSLVPDIAPYTESAESKLRAEAFDALRLKGGEESEKLIRKGLASEKNGEARVALSNSLSYREPDAETLDIAMNSMKDEKDEFVINNLLRYIYKAPDEDGKIDAFLYEAVQNEALPIDSRRGVINELRKRRK